MKVRNNKYISISQCSTGNNVLLFIFLSVDWLSWLISIVYLSLVRAIWRPLSWAERGKNVWFIFSVSRSQNISPIDTLLASQCWMMYLASFYCKDHWLRDNPGLAFPAGPDTAQHRRGHAGIKFSSPGQAGCWCGHTVALLRCWIFTRLENIEPIKYQYVSWRL